MGNDKNSLAHTTWNCKYHIVFAPKYRRQILYGELKVDIGKILRELCEWKGIKIIEAELCPNHIHMLIEIPPKFSVSGVIGFLKGKSSLLIHERHGNLKYKSSAASTPVARCVFRYCLISARQRCPRTRSAACAAHLGTRAYHRGWEVLHELDIKQCETCFSSRPSFGPDISTLSIAQIL